MIHRLADLAGRLDEPFVGRGQRAEELEGAVSVPRTRDPEGVWGAAAQANTRTGDGRKGASGRRTHRSGVSTIEAME